MSVGNWKKLLTLLNLAAILAMAGTAYGYIAHKQYLGDKTWKAPGFQPDPRPAEEIYADTSHTGIALGAPIEPVKADPNQGELAKPKEKPLIGLARLGEILNAVAVPPPYDYAYPTIEFKFRADGKEVILRYGEALINRTDPRRPGIKVPAQYRLVLCLPDEKEYGLYHFIFDVHCDRKEYARLSWRQGARPVSQVLVDQATVAGFSRSVGESGEIRLVESGDEDEFGMPTDEQLKKALQDGATAKAAGPGTTGNGAETQPAKGEGTEPPNKTDPVGVISEPVEPMGVKYWEDDDAGTSGMTDKGADYLKNNWKDLTKEVKLTPYRNSKTKQIEGVRVRKINEGSVARQFGVREQDVIISINGQRVTSQNQAISIIKREVNQRKKTKISVVIRRAGKEFTKNYDTRDPEARKAARDYARGRR